MRASSKYHAGHATGDGEKAEMDNVVNRFEVLASQEVPLDVRSQINHFGQFTLKSAWSNMQELEPGYRRTGDAHFTAMLVDGILLGRKLRNMRGSGEATNDFGIVDAKELLPTDDDFLVAKEGAEMLLARLGLSSDNPTVPIALNVALGFSQDAIRVGFGMSSV